MTKISYIHGIPQNEWKDRSRGVPRQTYINYPGMTDGQLRLNLINEQLNILAGFYPDVKEWKEARTQLSDYLNSGINGRRIGDRYILPFIKREINLAKWRTRSASAVNGIPMSDCSKWDQEIEDVYGNITHIVKEPEYSKCARDNRYKNLLNDNLEGSSHHLLYAYVGNKNNEPNIVGAKSLNQSLAIQNLSKLSGLSETNLKLWIRNGVMRSNITHGSTPMQPEKTIDIMRTGIPYQYNSKIGEPISATLIVLAKVISAIVAAIASAAALISSMNQTDQMKMQNATSNFSLPSFGPEKSDYEGWYTGPGSSPGNNGGTAGSDLLDNLTNSDNLPLILGGAAALYFLK